MLLPVISTWQIQSNWLRILANNTADNTHNKTQILPKVLYGKKKTLHAHGLLNTQLNNSPITQTYSLSSCIQETRVNFSTVGALQAQQAQNEEEALGGLSFSQSDWFQRSPLRKSLNLVSADTVISHSQYLFPALGTHSGDGMWVVLGVSAS